MKNEDRNPHLKSETKRVKRVVKYHNIRGEFLVRDV